MLLNFHHLAHALTEQRDPPSMAGVVAEPLVFPPYVVRRALVYPATIIKLLWPRAEMNPALKAVLTLLLLVNWTSFPLLWHIRMFWEAYRYRMRQFPVKSIYFPFFKTSAAALTIPGVEPRLRIDRLPLGKDIFEDVTTFRFTAFPGECE